MPDSLPTFTDPRRLPAANGEAPRVNGTPTRTVVAVIDPPAQHRVPDPPVKESELDYAIVRRLRDDVAEELRDQIAGPEVTRAAAVRHVTRWVDDQRRSGAKVDERTERLMVDTVVADLVGLGRLEAMLADPDIENVHIFGPDVVRLKYADGTVARGPSVADSNDDLLALLQNLGRRTGATERAMTSAEPWLDLELPDGSRLAGLYEVTPAARGGDVTSVVHAQIRRHRIKDADLDDLLAFDMIDPLMHALLGAAVEAGLNIMIAGKADAGKTTLLRALASRIPANTTVATLEESRELGLHETGRHDYVMSLETRQGHGDLRADGRPRGEITAADLIPRLLRMSMSRVIVGEVRGREIIPMLDAMTTSQGSLCTIHTRRPGLVMDRIVTLALAHGKDMTAELAQRMAAGALDLIVYVSIDDESGIGGRTHRYVSHIVELDGGFEAGKPLSTELFAPGSDGRGIPRHQPHRTAEALRLVGYDQRQLQPYIATGEGAWRRPLQRVRRVTAQ